MKKRYAASIVYLAISNFSFAAQAAGSQCSALFSNERQSQVKIELYLKDTLNSLEHMRGENGLVKDTIFVRAKEDGNHQIQTLNDKTSPTNIAVDILIQSEMALRPEKAGASKVRLDQLVTTLEALEFHHETGLFFSRYRTTSNNEITDYAVSSIDNFHLAVALWTTKEAFPGTVLAVRAKKLFERMDFSVYLDEADGLIGGNLKYNKETGAWTKEAYNFDDMGSEARGLYSAGWALGLFHKMKDDPAFPARALARVRAEVVSSDSGNLLKLWDGSAFQLYFPKMFLNEENYSPVMRSFYQALGEHMVAEGLRRNLETPAAHSAGWSSLSENGFSENEPNYRDKAGNISVVSSLNNDVNRPDLRDDWDATFTPYALFMAGTANVQRFMPILSSFQELKSSDGKPFYASNIGFMDGYQVKGPSQGKVISAQLALNQGMLALSLLQMEASDGMSLSSRLMYGNSNIRKRLQYFYSLFDKKIERENSQKRN